MKFSMRNVLLPLMVFGGLFLAIGCTQSDDIVQPQVSTTITLDPEYLPELENIYVYELWMVKVKNDGDDITAPDAEFVSLGKFLWDNSINRFRDLNDSLIGDRIELPESWFAYDYIVLSIENRIDDNTAAPSGVYLLVDEVVNQNIRPIVMNFPVSMFLATGYYFVTTPTNDYTYYDLGADSLVRVSENEEKGLWICSRFLTERNLHDTLAVLSMEVTMVVDTFDTVGRHIVDTIGIIWPGEWVVDTMDVIFGYDTLQHRRINIVWDTLTDTMYDYIRYPVYDIDSQTTVAYPHPLGRIPYYEYSGPLEEVPDVSPFGWRYNAWVMLEQPDPGETLDNTGLNLSTMIPFASGAQEAFTGLNSWGVLPLGGFNIASAPDLSNPYIDNLEVPQFPGEDFVLLAASPRFDNLNLRRVANESWGFVVIGIEPDASLLTTNPDVNFPLFFLSDEIPSGDAGNVNLVHEFHNWSNFLPEIHIDVEMHD